MFRFVVKRLLQSIPVLFFIVTITFLMVRLAPGGPFDAEKTMSPDVLKRLNELYNLDAPLHIQFINYLQGLITGDLGPSLSQTAYSVNELIAANFPISLELGIYALLVSMTIGLIAGVIAATRPNSFWDYIPMSTAMAGICIPNFVLGPLLVLVFSIWLGWLPVSGWDEPSSKILPSITLGATYAAYIARLSRGGMLEIMSQDFIRTARAKGLSEFRVVVKHGLKGGLQPVVSFMGPAAAGLLSGSFVVERIFDIPGLGHFFVRGAFARDYTLITGTVLFYATLIVCFNLVVDVAQAWLDPRLRQSTL